MIDGKTSSGFRFRVYEKAIHDFRFLMAYKGLKAKDQDKNTEASVDLVLIILGEDQTEKLMKHVADKYGNVPAERIYSELGEIIATISKADKQTKKS
ncbi:hypothetical protein J2S20_002322 [Moryella indoligenes]|uniref:Uncharacterized protein n=1 Tax=Moryella indoligenes TaxID=371674 RepID=A0AAE3VC66_9FIRM|nr:hypothetical protein [Moryella indoligenes]MDQ0153601.1 hypothetical protein [Moryella indoligenes]